MLVLLAVDDLIDLFGSNWGPDSDDSFAGVGPCGKHQFFANGDIL